MKARDSVYEGRRDNPLNLEEIRIFKYLHYVRQVIKLIKKL